MDYFDFGYTVGSCPLNITAQNEAASRLKCGVDQFGNSQYLCVPNFRKTTIVEYCYKGTVGLQNPGSCLVVNDEGVVDDVSCRSFTKGCTTTHFKSFDLYQYPACHEINRKEQCFYADPKCPKIDTEMTTRNSTFVATNATMNDTATTLGFSNTTEITETGQIPAGAKAAITIASLMTLAILFFIYMMYLYTERKGKRDKERESVPLMNRSEDNFRVDDYGPASYTRWKTCLSDQFSTLTDDEVSVLFCYLCSDSGPPDFTDTEWLDLLYDIRQDVYGIKYYPLTSDEAQQTLDRLKSRDYLWEDQDKITEDTKNETMYMIASRSHGAPFRYSSYDTASVYLRSQGYNRKPGEKCVSTVLYDSLLILRLQMNVLTHVTMEDTHIYEYIYKILNVSNQILKKSEDERKKILSDLRREGEAVHHRGRSHDSKNHVTWLRRYKRPDIVRSCIGLHQHYDIYIIDNKPHRKPSKYHKYTSDIRGLMYCLLLVDGYTLNTTEDSFKDMLNKLRDKYFKEEEMSNEISTADLPEGIMQIKDNTITFKSDDIRHDVMYAFVTECIIKESDLEFFLKTASGHVITEYCRSWKYERNERERCLYVPEYPNMLDPVIERLQLDIIKYCSISDREIRDKIIESLEIPVEILEWDQEARERYVEYAKRGTQTVHHARGMIVGCAGAGKTTLLKRLLGCSKKDIKKVKPTQGLEVHEEIFKIDDDTKRLEELIERKDRAKGEFPTIKEVTKKLTLFDFGGQCAYYACHQIYLTRRAFYVVVVDASKCLGDQVDKAVCDQEGSIFSGWTYGDYFVFWIKSIHTYCGDEKEGDQIPSVVIVATHWEKRIKKYKDKNAFLESLLEQLPKSSNLTQYIKQDDCFCIQFHVPINKLVRRIIEIASNFRWVEKIPKEWAKFGNDLQKTRNKRIVDISSIELDCIVQNIRDDEMMKTQDMLRFYHDVGKVLYFNETGLKESVIIDVQWFVDIFKNIITDTLHVKGITGSSGTWYEYYATGNLKDSLLENIWANSGKTDTLCHKQTILNFMQRLGLVAVGKESHYIPCMNRKEMAKDIQTNILQSSSKSPVVLYRFDILPFFFFFRLVVACMQEEGWSVPTSKGISYLYRNVTLFAFGQYNVILSVTSDSIQLQVLHTRDGQSLDENITRQIQRTVEKHLNAITGTFHKQLMFVRGIRCQEDQSTPFAMEIQGYFLEEKDLQSEDNDQTCPLHRFGRNQHDINTHELKKYWVF